MNPFRRIATTVSASFELLMNQIENHEELANSIIRDVTQASNQAKVKLQYLKKDRELLQKRIDDLLKQEEIWTKRVKKEYEKDAKTALECVKRLKRVKADRVSLEEQKTEHEKTEKQLTNDLRVIEDKLAALRRKKNTLSTRESRAKALKTFGIEEGGLLNEIDSIFGNWENKVMSTEVVSGYVSDSIDDFEDSFTEEEENEELKEYLEIIVQECEVKDE